MIYIVDIDGTIANTENSDYKNSKPILCRIKKINELYDQGHTIIYMTARGAISKTDWKDFTAKQLEEWGVKYTSLEIKKPHYDIWIDDKAFNVDVIFGDE